MSRVILNGDHAEFEAEWAGKDPKDRPDWPLPSFDARDWAESFCKIANGFGFKDAEGKPIDEGWMQTWFANALMRGFDEHASRPAWSCGARPSELSDPPQDCAWPECGCDPLASKVIAALQEQGALK